MHDSGTSLTSTAIQPSKVGRLEAIGFALLALLRSWTDCVCYNPTESNANETRSPGELYWETGVANPPVFCYN